MASRSPRKTASAASQTASAASKPSTPSHQTHGGYTPVSGPITNVRQLTRGANLAKGSIGGFASLTAYSTYLKSLSAVDLHRHAIEEAHMVAIDDRERLIRRLENEWSMHNQRESQGAAKVPTRAPFTPEQIAKQEELKRKMLGGRA